MLNNLFSFYLIERKINFILFFKFKFKNYSYKIILFIKKIN